MAAWSTFGWGGFNPVVGIVDRHVCRCNHVRPGLDQLVYDLAFLLVGAVLLIVGAGLVRSTTPAGHVPPV